MSQKYNFPFIVLEGIDNSGKSTVGRLLAGRINAQFIQFPDRSSKTGKEIDSFLKKDFLKKDVKSDNNEKQKDVKSDNNESLQNNEKQNFLLQMHRAIYERNMEMQILFSKNRYEKADFILETLKTKPVVSDRYWISGAVYSCAKGLDFQECKIMDSGLPMPDYTFFLNFTPEICAKRQGFGEEAHDNVGFQEKVYEIYQKIDENMIFIEGGTIKEVVEKIIEKIK